MNEEDLVIETYTDASPGVWVRILHKPSGLWVAGAGAMSGSLKKKLIQRLAERLKEDKT